MIAGNLFTRDYLLEGIARTGQWNALSEADLASLKRRLTELAGAILGNANPNEAETEHDLIYPVLEALGWSEIQPQQALARGRKHVPDALLLPDAEAKARAVAEKDQEKRFQHGLAILEAKRWGRALDRTFPGTHHEGAPATQMLQYLSRVDIQTNGNVRLGILTNGNVRLGILTNGERWRLYYQGALSVARTSSRSTSPRRCSCLATSPTSSTWPTSA